MSTIKSSNETWVAGLLTATAASLCCITPVLALISGTSGIASTFSWMEPYRPYLIGLTISVLGFAWYQKLKPKKAEVECDCEEGKPSFWRSKTFLAIVQVKLISSGMDCEACSQTINLALSKVPGVLEYRTEYKDGSSTVKFDNSKASEKAIINAVNKTGYKVTNIQSIQ